MPSVQINNIWKFDGSLKECRVSNPQRDISTPIVLHTADSERRKKKSFKNQRRQKTMEGKFFAPDFMSGQIVDRWAYVGIGDFWNLDDAQNNQTGPLGPMPFDHVEVEDPYVDYSWHPDHEKSLRSRKDQPMTSELGKEGGEGSNGSPGSGSQPSPATEYGQEHPQSPPTSHRTSEHAAPANSNHSASDTPSPRIASESNQDPRPSGEGRCGNGTNPNPSETDFSSRSTPFSSFLRDTPDPYLDPLEVSASSFTTLPVLAPSILPEPTSTNTVSLAAVLPPRHEELPFVMSSIEFEAGGESDDGRRGGGKVRAKPVRKAREARQKLVKTKEVRAKEKEARRALKEAKEREARERKEREAREIEAKEIELKKFQATEQGAMQQEGMMTETKHEETIKEEEVKEKDSKGKEVVRDVPDVRVSAQEAAQVAESAEAAESVPGIQHSATTPPAHIPAAREGESSFRSLPTPVPLVWDDDDMGPSDDLLMKVAEGYGIHLEKNQGEHPKFPFDLYADFGGIEESTEQRIGGGPMKSSARRQKVDKANPPRPPNSFILYRRHLHHRLRTHFKGGHATSNNLISKLAGDCWRQESAEIKKGKFEVLATHAKQMHAKRYPAYKYQPKKHGEKTSSLAKHKTARKGSISSKASSVAPESKAVSGAPSTMRSSSVMKREHAAMPPPWHYGSYTHQYGPSPHYAATSSHTYGPASHPHSRPIHPHHPMHLPPYAAGGPHGYDTLVPGAEEGMMSQYLDAAHSDYLSGEGAGPAAQHGYPHYWTHGPAWSHHGPHHKPGTGALAVEGVVGMGGIPGAVGMQ